MIIGYTLPEIWHVTNIIVIFHFGLFFGAPPAPLTAQIMKISKKKKKEKYQEISFYTSAPKIMTICYTIIKI